MKTRNWKIGQWLLSSFTIILIFVVALGMVSQFQANKLNLQTTTMYNHPLAVRRSIDTLKLDISKLRTELRTYIIATSIEEEERARLSMELLVINAERQFDVLNENYLGSLNDIEEAYNAFVVWSNIREHNIVHIEDGNIDLALDSISKGGEEAIVRDILLSQIAIIDDYATSKSDELYNNSIELYETVTMQLIIMVFSLFIFITAIGIWLYRSFKTPLASMNETVLKLQSGDLGNRIDYLSKNELGVLATSFNSMADVIEDSEQMHSKVNNFSEVLISENKTKSFFRVVLESLMTNTESIASAVYLINDENSSYDCYDSIGLQSEKLQSYKENTTDGDIGQTLLKKKINILQVDENITSYTYNSIMVGIVPKEIMNIPLISHDKVIAIITLATITKFDSTDLDFIKRIVNNLNSKTESILANEKINVFVAELEQRSTELVTQNSELEMQKKQLDEASKLKSNFLSNMSHELRTPLNSVIALSGVLFERLNGKISTEEYSYLEIIRRNGKNLLSLINDILDISRIESGKVELEIKTFSTNTLITEIVSMFAVQAKEKGIELNYIKPETDIYMQSDYDKCIHIVQNLVSNAVKFTQNGNVTIEVKSTYSDVEIMVKDTGIGIAQKNLISIFEEFKQAETGTSRRFGGTGLGLSIASKFANMLEGSIKVTSRIDKGTTFTLSLPKESVNKIDVNDDFDYNNLKLPRNVEPNLALTTEDIYDKTVLLIEDNESVVIQVKELVKGMGINILVAEGGELGLQMLHENKIQAIILDLMMPGIDGFEVLKEVRNDDRTAKIPVLILTAKHITKKDLKLLKRNSIHQLIQKGDIDRLELQSTIFDMLFDQSKIETKKLKKDIRPTILIVEDNADNRTTLKAILKDSADLIMAIDGEQGIEYAIKHTPDLILMDIALPKINGIEAFREIRRTKGFENIPIIAVSASALEEEKQEILTCGFDDFVAKPINVEELMESIERVLYYD
jgi:signal transduction histidine kinase/CheY-like chemotaxis protein/CHASE3 domain sensor protein